MLKQSYFFNYDQSGRRGHSNKLFKRRSRLDIRKFAFSCKRAQITYFAILITNIIVTHRNAR